MTSSKLQNVMIDAPGMIGETVMIMLWFAKMGEEACADCSVEGEVFVSVNTMHSDDLVMEEANKKWQAWTL